HLGVEEGFRAARKAHPALVVSDLEELCQVLVAGGHEVRRNEDVPGTPQWYVDDPFGNRIELIPG
ncbi:MAG TPA: VOC family protein, partial [Acidimicrobiales bacterium]|nr:VOC family protein [Acidimicrobiales bacterium]